MKNNKFLWIPKGIAFLLAFVYTFLYFIDSNGLYSPYKLLTFGLWIAFFISVYAKKNTTKLFYFTNLGTFFISIILATIRSGNRELFGVFLFIAVIVFIINANLFYIFSWKPMREKDQNQCQSLDAVDEKAKDQFQPASPVDKKVSETNPRIAWKNKALWFPRWMLMIALTINLIFVCKEGINIYDPMNLVFFLILLFFFALTFLIPIISAIFNILISSIALLFLYSYDGQGTKLEVLGINWMPISFWIILIASVFLFITYFNPHLFDKNLPPQEMEAKDEKG